MEVSAWAIALLSPIAGPIDPMAMHRAEAAMEAIATQLELSMDQTPFSPR